MKKLSAIAILTLSSVICAACSTDLQSVNNITSPSTSALKNNQLTSNQNSHQSLTQTSQTTDQTGPKLSVQPETTITVPVTILDTQESKKLTFENYRQWMLNSEVVNGNIFDWQTWQSDSNEKTGDCYAVMNGNTDGGDLLSTLIADTDVRSKIKLTVYTQDYVKALENKIVATTHQKDQSDFYANSVCHLGKDADVVTGFLWPRGEKTVSEEDILAHDKDKDFKPKKDGISAVILVHNNSVRIFENMQSYNSTATGGETYPCEGKIDNENFYWACFEGLNFDVANNTTKSKMAEVKIPLNGGQMTLREYTE